MKPYLRLCRLSTVFTALSNILAGFLLSHTGIEPVRDLVLLLGCSAGLYLSGMVFNDLFDVNQDSLERPNRPIPSGDVSWKNGAIFATALMLFGLACAFAAGRVTLIIAIALAVCILLYDGVMKRTPLGPVFMGICRTLNLILGATSTSARLSGAFQQPLIWYAACIGIYIIGVTWFARREAKENRRLPLALSLIVIDIGLAGIAFWLADLSVRAGFFIPPGALAGSTSILILWGVIALTINRRALAAVTNPTPTKIQPAVGTMLLSVIMLDAMVIYFKMGPTGLPYAIATLALLIPAMLLRRVIPLT